MSTVDDDVRELLQLLEISGLKRQIEDLRRQLAEIRSVGPPDQADDVLAALTILTTRWHELTSLIEQRATSCRRAP